MSKQITIDSLGTFKSIQDAADALDIPYPTLWKHLKDGNEHLIIERVHADKTIKITGQGVFSTTADAAEATGISEEIIKKARPHGFVKSIPINVPGYGDFSSISEFARLIGVHSSTAEKAYHQGRPLENLKPRKPLPRKNFTIPGFGTFRSNTEAAKATGFAPATIRKYKKNGWLDRLQHMKPSLNRIPVKVRDVEYPSTIACARALGLDTSTVLNARRGGQHALDLLGIRTSDGKLVRFGTLIKYFNGLYPNMKYFAKRTGHSYTTVYRYVEAGKSVEDLNLPKNRRKAKKGISVTFYGKTMPSLNFLARLLEVTPATVRRHWINNTLTSLVADNDDRWNTYIRNLRNIKPRVI